MAVEEITAQQLESEIVRHEGIAIIDVRPAGEVSRWKISAEGLPFLNVPAESIVADVEDAKSLIAGVARNNEKLRVICNRGRASLGQRLG